MLASGPCSLTARRLSVVVPWEAHRQGVWIGNAGAEHRRHQLKMFGLRMVHTYEDGVWTANAGAKYCRHQLKVFGLQLI